MPMCCISRTNAGPRSGQPNAGQQPNARVKAQIAPMPVPAQLRSRAPVPIMLAEPQRPRNGPPQPQQPGRQRPELTAQPNRRVTPMLAKAVRRAAAEQTRMLISSGPPPIAQETMVLRKVRIPAAQVRRALATAAQAAMVRVPRVERPRVQRLAQAVPPEHTAQARLVRPPRLTEPQRPGEPARAATERGLPMVSRLGPMAERLAPRAERRRRLLRSRLELASMAKRQAAPWSRGQATRTARPLPAVCLVTRRRHLLPLVRW